MRDDAYGESDSFTEAEKAAIAWAHHLTKYTFSRHPEALENMKKHYDHAQIVEATLVSGYFNMWNRFTDALESDLEGVDEMSLFTKSAVIHEKDFVEFMNNCWWAREGAAAEGAGRG